MGSPYLLQFSIKWPRVLQCLFKIIEVGKNVMISQVGHVWCRHHCRFNLGCWAVALLRLLDWATAAGALLAVEDNACRNRSRRAKMRLLGMKRFGQKPVAVRIIYRFQHNIKVPLRMLSQTLHQGRVGCG